VRLGRSRLVVLAGATVVACVGLVGLAVGAAERTRPHGDVSLGYPEGCAAYGLSEPRCAYVMRWAARQVGADPASPLTFELLGDPILDSPGCTGPTRCLTSRTQAFIVRVRVHDGPETLGEASVFCGIGSDAWWACTETPVIATRTPTSNGYRDVPCSGEDAEVCATPVPTARPDAIAAAVPLRVEGLAVPIDRVGAHEVVVGDAVLPNGILGEATLDIAPSAPSRLVIAPDGAVLGVQSLEGGPPFDNAYEHGWRSGTERVRVTLSFTVEEFGPGATLDVQRIVVR